MKQNILLESIISDFTKWDILIRIKTYRKFTLLNLKSNIQQYDYNQV